MKYVFDVDGTLTPSRRRIDPRFEIWFTHFCRTHEVSIATGSDVSKTREQLGESIWKSLQYSFNCNTAEIWKSGKVIHRESWKCPDDLWLYLEDSLYASQYRSRYGRHFEERPGMLNFSIVGRGAYGHERTQYYEWDCIYRERETLARTINDRWPDVCARVGGETGIDISARGVDKSRVLDWIDGSITFFGDSCVSPGNDAPLADILRRCDHCVVYEVDSWETTWDILKRINKSNDEYEKKIASRV